MNSIDPLRIKDLLQIASSGQKFAIIFYRTTEGTLKNSIKFLTQNLQFSSQSLIRNGSNKKPAIYAGFLCR
ncbi:MAG: hypothetical protein A3D44_01840 [Candidatus Staskawiczbacteria bacterium RIFCSPHIGHO2_02_FULL_42_22]|uniref:Uncharacterized protein n=1 Tax=Candidatus Staskawiczbacteria bacterium RIFCSPHIGHO2_02_FULL_42_22 TaxID=1802207 RepID=A0A1G2I1T8_9BACT|nr:MAG: hypothetical protein A2W40_03925 [Candidatus Giovannonibacteria bacterium RIFCSPHIGHO2_01_45_12]OGZ68390.1 MAG: hypothetical protein A3D44_01840 [Candidatus Staskawiczbacteria bacterium RIFCSPHIGHO2_02_FULL_42_22]